MTRPKIHIIVLGGTITMLPKPDGGIVPALSGDDLIASIPQLADHAEVSVSTPFLVPSPSITFDHLHHVLETMRSAFAEGAAGVVVVQGTDTIDETAFLLDLAHDGPGPVVVTGAMRGAAAPSADGNANLLAAVVTAASPHARDIGALAVLNDEIHAGRFVQKMHKGLPSSFQSPGLGPIGYVLEGRATIALRPSRLPRIAAMPVLARVAIVKTYLGDDPALLDAIPGLGFKGLVIEAMGAGHVPEALAASAARLAGEMPVVLGSRVPGGPVFHNTYAFTGSETDLLAKGLIAAGVLSTPKARLLLAYLIGAGFSRQEIAAHFASFH